MYAALLDDALLSAARRFGEERKGRGREMVPGCTRGATGGEGAAVGGTCPIGPLERALHEAGDRRKATGQWRRGGE